MARKYNSVERMEKWKNSDEINVAIITHAHAIHLRLTSQSALLPAILLIIRGTF